MNSASPLRYVDEREAAVIIGFSVQSLRNWRGDSRRRGAGPPYIKRGRSVRYLLSDLLAWMEEGRINRGNAG